MSFKTYLQESQYLLTEDEKFILEFNLLQISMALNNYDIIQEDLMTENLWQKSKDMYTDFSSQFNKKKTLGHYVMDFTKTAGKILLAGIKNDKERVKELTRRYNREDFFEFLWRLDLNTLGLLTTPLGIIEMVTGWDIKDFLKRKIKSTRKHLMDIVQTFDDLKKDLAMVFKPSKHPDVFNAVDNFKKTIKVKLDPLLKGNIKVSINKGIKA